MRAGVAIVVLSVTLAWAAPSAAQEPGPEAPPAPAAAVAAPAAPAVSYAVGTRLRGIFVPAWFLEAFMHHAHGLSSISWGADFTRRKGNLDLVFGLDFGWYGNLPDANWTGTGSFADDTYYTQFRNFVTTQLTVGLMWHHDFTDWLSLRYGGGIGLMFLTGDMYRQLSGPSCSGATVDNQAQCHPGFNGAFPRFAEDLSSYRVLPVVAAEVGLRFKLHPHAYVIVDGGFQNAFFFGASGQYVF
jgi:hypothetical protein